MSAEEPDLSILTGEEGYDFTYSDVSEFTDYLKDDLSSEECEDGRVFWRPERHDQQSEYELYHGTSSISSRTGIKERIKTALIDIASDGTLNSDCLVQFWASKVDGRHHYLTTSDQPFFLGIELFKGVGRYRKRCMDDYIVVEEGAKEEQLGPVGRVYRNKDLESSPDLRLYSTNEFPLRDYAARCGLRSYLAVPVFDNECYGVLEVLCSETGHVNSLFYGVDRGLKAAGLRSTHILYPIDTYKKLTRTCPTQPQPLKYQQPFGEISEMLELAIKAITPLHTAQVWVPCRQCANMSNNLSYMERAAFINVGDGEINSIVDIDENMIGYLQACVFYDLQIEKGFARALISSNSKSYFCRNLCDFSILENPLAHYAQKARLSIYFALCLENVHDCNDLYVIEFFLQTNSREDACGGSFLGLLFRIMEMKLKSFRFASEGQLREELLVESSQPNAIGYESSEYAQGRKHQHSDELNIFTVMEERRHERYSESDFTNYLQTADFCCQRPPFEYWSGWVFCSPAREGLSENDFNSNSALVPRPIKEKIRHCMIEITSEGLFRDHYSLVQFWAPKMEEDRCYLATSDQPFTLGCLAKGLATFRKQCMKHHYFVDERVKEEELGPPGRVFRNRLPEITPDFCLYSTRDFPLRNQAVHCCLKNYFALPVFDIHQRICVGVLEFVGVRQFPIESFLQTLKTAGLSSTHICYWASFEASQVPPSVAEQQQLALAEVEDALQLMAMIPQLYMAEVWVPYGENVTINGNLSCMKLALSTKSRRSESDVDFRYVQIGKGITGTVLASENKLCFCQNSCRFSTVEEPLAHFKQRERLDVCFAICLQSSYTGNLLYVLEFFFHQGPSNYEYFCSPLSFLLSIMKQELKSFKVATGQQLGEELVVEVIEFSEANKLTFSELNQRDIFPFKFRIVQYGQKEHQHSKDQQVQCHYDGMDSVRNVAHATRRCNAAANSEKDDAAKKTVIGKRKISLNLTLEALKPHFGKKLKDVAKELGVGRSTIKRACRYYGIRRWPCNENHKKNSSLFEIESADRIVRDSQPNTWPSSSGNHLLLEMPPQQNVLQTIINRTQHSPVQPEAQGVIVKAKYEDNIIKFHLCHSPGMNKIVEEVAMRLNLKMGSFKLKYLDEDNDEILLACDGDLQLCLKSLTAVGKTCLQLFVQSIRK